MSSIVELDNLGRAFARGNKKEAVACVWIKEGSGQVQVKANGKLRTLQEHFKTDRLINKSMSPFAVVEASGKFDVFCRMHGSGLSSQAHALMHGIAKALVSRDAELKLVLKQAGMITRDSRVVERKKYGRAKARKSFQFSKR